ncbi:MAG TPA: ABC transporter permease [Candidatus Acidoferrum sp.]|nr:ABC transporter permease [Candidatus Acidoferrum sp.]
MSAISVQVPSELPVGAVMPASRLLKAYLTEAKYETVRMLRTPAFAIPFLSLPALLYLLFGVVIFGAAIRNDVQTGLFIFAAFALFGVMGPGMFGFGMLVAGEREHGLLTFKRALPMPPPAYLVAKLLMAVMFAVIVTATMLAVLPFGHLKLTAGQLFAATAVSILGALPFCAIGLFIGVLTTSRSAPAFVNIIYQVMMHVSGLFYPLPKFLRAIAPVWPTYHLQQLFFRAIGMSSQGRAITHVTVLVVLTFVLTFVAIRRLALKG